MNRSTILIGVALLGVTAGATLYTAGRADAIPLPGHRPTGELSNVHCINGANGAWAVTVNIDATNPELHPIAETFTYTGNVVHNVALPYTYAYTITGPIFHAAAHVVWSDGYNQDIDLGTATRPDDCTPPSTPPPTSCPAPDGPPVQGCPYGGTAPTTAPPETTVPTTAPAPTTTTTICTTPVTLEDGGETCNDTYHAPPNTPAPPTNPPASSGRIAQLPPTGKDGWKIAAWIIFACLVVGFGLIFGSRIDRNRHHKDADR